MAFKKLLSCVKNLKLCSFPPCHGLDRLISDYVFGILVKILLFDRYFVVSAFVFMLKTF